jgi:hypothetical protein
MMAGQTSQDINSNGLVLDGGGNEPFGFNAEEDEDEDEDDDDGDGAMALSPTVISIAAESSAKSLRPYVGPH